MSEVNLNTPLNKLRDDLYILEATIRGLNDRMYALDPYIKEFREKKALKKRLKKNRDMLQLHIILLDELTQNNKS